MKAVASGWWVGAGQRVLAPRIQLAKAWDERVHACYIRAGSLTGVLTAWGSVKTSKDLWHWQILSFHLCSFPMLIYLLKNTLQKGPACHTATVTMSSTTSREKHTLCSHHPLKAHYQGWGGDSVTQNIGVCKGSFIQHINHSTPGRDLWLFPALPYH
jgi:hypothetical protein